MDLTKIVQEAQKEAERIEIKDDVKLSSKILGRDFIQLVKLVFGEEYCAIATGAFVNYHVPVDHKDSLFLPSLLGENYLYLGKETKTRFFKRKKVKFTRAIEVSHAIVRGEYLDLNIQVYIPEAMEKARVFAIAYEKVSGKKASVIRAYQKKEDVEKLLPQVKEAKKRHNPEITPEDRALNAFDSLKKVLKDKDFEGYKTEGLGFNRGDDVVIVKNLGKDNEYLYGGATTWFDIGLKGVVKGLKQYGDTQYVVLQTKKGGFAAHPDEIKKV
ncbi:hypothetical protein HY837_02810 [archaeon]|nr:hypothetical protein [archaeon]